MRRIAFVAGLLITVSLFARANGSELSDEAIVEILLTDAYPIFTGDDGEECDVVIESLDVLKRGPDGAVVHFRARRDITRHGCAPELMTCTARITRGSAGHWQADADCP